MSAIFKHLMIDAALGLLIFGGTATACSEKSPAPEPKTTASPTDENGMPIEVPIPTGCKGRIKDRIVAEDGSAEIVYYIDSTCSKTRSAKITEEQDLNSSCEPDDYYDLCLTPWKTEPPGIRQPSEPAE